MFVKIFDLVQEQFGILQLPENMIKRHLVFPSEHNIFRHIPHPGKSTVGINDFPCTVNDQDSVGSGFKGGVEQRQ